MTFMIPSKLILIFKKIQLCRKQANTRRLGTGFAECDREISKIAKWSFLHLRNFRLVACRGEEVYLCPFSQREAQRT
jgi:hypothetical protein